MALRAKQSYEQALRAWSRALELQPGMRNIAIPYGQLLYKMNRIDQAQEFYGRWCGSHPDDPIAKHMLAAMNGGAGPDRASDGYVRAIFDDFADSFDERLEQLEYRAPQLLHRAAMQSAEQESVGTLSVLDLGCGTGLCGPLFLPMARRIVGVDLSSRMLSKAATRECYRQLNFGELTDYLGDCPERFDLVLAADVLCYFGALLPVFEGVQKVLAPRGRFIFSVESAHEGPEPRRGDGYTIRPHGRYDHARDYVQQTLDRAGLRAMNLIQDTLRLERGTPVAGLIVVATSKH
jgi:predicted TPR repeat methyltransferase